MLLVEIDHALPSTPPQGEAGREFIVTIWAGLGRGRVFDAFAHGFHTRDFHNEKKNNFPGDSPENISEIHGLSEVWPRVTVVAMC